MSGSREGCSARPRRGACVGYQYSFDPPHRVPYDSPPDLSGYKQYAKLAADTMSDGEVMEARSRMLVGAGAIALMLALFVAIKAGRDGENAPPEAHPVAEGLAIETDAPPAPQQLTASAPVPTSDLQRADSGAQVALGDPFWDPKTQAEADWLSRNGFPSSRQMELGMSPSSLAVDFRTMQGHSPASLVAAQERALVDPTGRADAIAHLVDAARNGSIYALQVPGAVYQIGPQADVVQSEPYFRAAEFRGNWAAALHLRQQPISLQQQWYASLMAHQIIQNINRQRRRGGLSPLRVDERPGLDETVEIMRHGLDCATRPSADGSLGC